MRGILKSLLRRKRSTSAVNSKNELSNCLTTWDLTSLGIGATLGAGTYVVAGQVAATIAGPSVIVSFSLAALASILSGLCYAEFGARVPKTTGSAYAYSYYTVGEIWAFFIGWNLILEYMIGTAADARALSGCFDFVIGNTLRNFTLTHVGEFHSAWLGSYPDFLAFIVTIIVTLVLASGVKQSSIFTNIFNVLNMLVVCFIIIYGLFYADTRNWTEGKGFFPFGASGVLSGAATCFYAFVGFDIIATTGEEAKTASKSIPIAIVISLLIVFMCYFGVSAVLTLMLPFDQLDSLSPIPNAFAQKGLPVAKYIIAVGAVCGLAASLLGSLFPLPRIIYSMANDGLLFQTLSRVHSTTEVPIMATVYPGVLTAVFALLFNLNELVEMMSIGTLLAYTLVSLCVLILRYQPDEECERPLKTRSPFKYGMLAFHNDEQDYGSDEFDYETTSNGKISISNGYVPDAQEYEATEADSCTKPLLGNRDQSDSPGSEKTKIPTHQSGKIATINILLLLVWFFGFNSSVIYGLDEILSHNPLIIGVAVLFGALCVISIGMIIMQPPNCKKVSFKAPLAPGLPIVAVFANVFLMLKLSRVTWIRFGVWMGLGE